jgi:hypothetical protein
MDGIWGLGATEEVLFADVEMPENACGIEVLTRWTDGMRARGRERGEGELSRLCKALREGDAVAEIIVTASWVWEVCFFPGLWGESSRLGLTM